jgi:hypothetical protein
MRCKTGGVGKSVTIVRRGVAVVCLMAAGMLAACSSPPSNTAVVRGLLAWPLGSQPMMFHPIPTAGVVKVVQGSRLVASVGVGNTGEFSVQVPPGTYRLEGVPSSGTDASACSSRGVVVAKDKMSTVANVDCHYVGIAPG